MNATHTAETAKETALTARPAVTPNSLVSTLLPSGPTSSLVDSAAWIAPLADSRSSSSTSIGGTTPSAACDTTSDPPAASASSSRYQIVSWSRAASTGTAA